jgi:transcriptional regulator with XRE-family HTH domain
MKKSRIIRLCDKICLDEQMEEGKIMYHYQRLRDLREDADLKQKHLVELLNISAQQYSLYERGDREIPFHHVITLAKYYGVSIDYIAGLTNQKNHK